MATLQKTIVYAGSTIPADLKLIFELPSFRYSALPLAPSETTGGGPTLAGTLVRRELVSRRAHEHVVSGSSYAIEVFDYTLLATGDDRLHRQHILAPLSSDEFVGKSNLEDLSFTVPVTIFIRGHEHGNAELDVFEVIAQQHPDQPIVFINKRAYARLVDQLNLGAFGTLVLRALMGSIGLKDGEVGVSGSLMLAQLDAQMRGLSQRIAEAQRKLLLDALPAALERAKAFNLDSLVDFPIALGPIAAPSFHVEGTFTIRTDTPDQVSADTLDLYDLEIEYSAGSSSKTLPIRWRKPARFSGNEALAFDALIQDGSRPLALRLRSFDANVLWQRRLDGVDPVDAIAIEVPLLASRSSGDGVALVPRDQRKRLRGQVITSQRTVSVAELSVVLRAREGTQASWRVVGVGRSDGGGNFSMPYPYGEYSEAEVRVSQYPTSATAVSTSGGSDTSIADGFLYLHLGQEQSQAVPVDSKAGNETDCDCHSPKRAPRLPEQDDLIESDDYTQDIGGGCVKLTTPNRTLREYSHHAIVRVSDPDVADYTLEKITDALGATRFNLSGGAQTVVRDAICLNNPVRWQDAPDAASNLTLYQAVTVARGHVLHFKTVMKADGYSMGDLLYSLPLAPGQKKQIVTFESSHTLTGMETQTLAQGESLAASLLNDRSITDQLSGTLDETLAGSSSASTSGLSAGLGAAGSMGSVGGSLGVSGGFSNASSSAAQNSARNVGQFFSERLRQLLTQNAESYRRQNAMAVTTVKEGQRYNAATESVANHNHCHALTNMYFEVLRHYAIYQELSHVEECLFVPLLLTHFSSQNVAKWRDVLSRVLLPVPSHCHLMTLDTQPQHGGHPLLRGFDANERIRTNYSQVDYPPPGACYADESMKQVLGTLSLRVNLKRPKTRYDRIKSLPMITQTTTRQEVDVEATIKKNVGLAAIPFGILAMGTENRTVTEVSIVVGPIFDQFMRLDANYATVPPASCIRVVSFLPRSIPLPNGTFTSTADEFFENGANDKKLWDAYAKALGYTGDAGVYAMLEYYFSGKLISEWDEIFYNDLLPQVMRTVTDSIRCTSIHFDVTSLDSYMGGERTLRVGLRGSTTLTRKQLGDEIRITAGDPLRALHEAAGTVLVDNVRLSYITEHFTGKLFDGYVGDDLADGVKLYAPLTAADLREPRTEDAYIVQQLLEHLNSNIEYYNRALWRSLDPERRFAMLDGFQSETFTDAGEFAGLRSLASIVKNQLLAITGNSLVFPLAPGYRVHKARARRANSELMSYYAPTSPIPPYRLSVPTRGVFLETVQGACNTCEKVQPNTSQNWTAFGVDEPTPIAPLAPPTPATTDWRAAFKDFASPLVSIQNAPAAPAPAAGLAGLLDLLGKSDVFKDITGLQGNQSNAMATYQSNQENVRALAQMAQGLAMQQHNTANSQAIVDSITQARERGAISSSEEGELVRRHLGQQVDGGSIERETARTERERQRPSLVSSASSALQAGRTVRATRTDTDGNLESVDIGGAAGMAERGPIDVAWDVAPRRQPERPQNACWATAATMLHDWKRNASSDLEEVLRAAGRSLVPADEERFVTLLRAGAGLPATQKDAFIAALGLHAEPPASFGIDQYLSWLETYGPLWITTDAAPDAQFSPHARILVRIAGPDANDLNGTRFTFIDPATGSSATESFSDFVASFEQMASDTRAPLRAQVVHFDEPFSAGEGDGRSYEVPPNVWDWGYLVRLQSPVSLPDGFSNQLITQSLGVGTNLDLYEEEIVELPTVGGARLTAAELLEYIRLHLNEIIARGGESTTFTPIPGAERWTSPEPLGAVLDIAITMDSGYVVVSHFDAGRRWIFSTVTGPTSGSGRHPVSGNREFGIYRDQATGHWVFYTRGADRANVLSELEQIAFDGGHQLWMSVLRGVRLLVGANGGMAFSRLPPVRNNVVWSRLNGVLPRSIPLPASDV